MLVLGLAENVHDSCVSLVLDGTPVRHLELERLTRVKRDVFKSPEQAVRLAEWALRTLALPDPDIIAVVQHAVPALTPSIVAALSTRFPKASMVDVEHLDAHAGLALAAFAEADVFAIDGGGDRGIRWGQPSGALIRVSRTSGVVTRKPMPFASTDGVPTDRPFTGPIDGRMWTCVAKYLFADLHAAGKVMGLAGHARDPRTWAGIGPRVVERSLDWHYDNKGLAQVIAMLTNSAAGTPADLAAWLQDAYSASLVGAVLSLDGTRPLAMVGGCALNVISNTEIRKARADLEVWVPPCPGDEGISLGAALLVSAQCGSEPTEWANAFLGIGGTGEQVSEGTYDEAANLLAGGGVLAIATGASEVGPRALGNRSLVCIPTIENKVRVSERIKKRERFRPVAPAILADRQEAWLKDPTESPFMSFSATASDQMRELAPGAVHVDGSVRHQSVSAASSPHLYELLLRVEERTGVPILINTSLNQAGEPIIGDSADAIRFCLRTDVDGLLGPSGLTEFKS